MEPSKKSVLKISQNQIRILIYLGGILKIAKCRGVKHLHTVAAKKEWAENTKTPLRILSHKSLHQNTRLGLGEPLEYSVLNIWQNQNKILNFGSKIIKIAKCRGVKHLHTVAAKKEWVKNIKMPLRILSHKSLHQNTRFGLCELCLHNTVV